MGTTFAFFDIDGTLITENVWSRFLATPSIAPGKRGAYLRMLPAFAARKLGLVDEARFREAWVQGMARLTAGWSPEQMDALYDRIVLDELRDAVRADVAGRAHAHAARGDRVVLISGMFSGFAERFARLLGAETGLGTRLAYVNGACAGRIDGRGCAGEQKPVFMRDYAGADSLASAYAYADSYSDVPMLSAVGHPVAVYPDRTLRAHAQAHQWEIIG